jgi:glycosyltransferase involved in cell wall biosynthesis
MSRPASTRTAPVEIVIPVYNEAGLLARSVTRLHRFAANELPYPIQITIADNASTDRTLAIAHSLAESLAGVAVLHLDAKGRGRALRVAWARSSAEVVGYMDVDLSTELRFLTPLLESLLGGACEVAIGSRLAAGALVTRGAKRELISRVYNKILHVALGAGFSDAQCGFKAGRREAIVALLDEVEDDNWFFDTELLWRAERHGMRIHEVAVEWVDDPDSRVDILATAIEDLRGIVRLRRCAAATREDANARSTSRARALQAPSAR